MRPVPAMMQGVPGRDRTLSFPYIRGGLEGIVACLKLQRRWRPKGSKPRYEYAGRQYGRDLVVRYENHRWVEQTTGMASSNLVACVSAASGRLFEMREEEPSG